MKKLKILLFLLLIGLNLFSIDLNLENSAVANASSGINLIYLTPSSAYYNPAFFAKGIETSYTALFSLNELSYYNLCGGVKLKRFNISSGLSYLDNPEYVEGTYFVGMSASFMKTNFGLTARTLFNKIGDDAYKIAYLFDVGFHKKFSRLSIAMSCKNITASRFDGEKLPIYMLSEASYKLTSKSVFALGIEKQTQQDFIFRFALSYKVSRYFSIFSGYQFDPQRIGAGFLVKIKKINFSYSIRTHDYLNLTHYLSLGYDL